MYFEKQIPFHHISEIRICHEKNWRFDLLKGIDSYLDKIWDNLFCNKIWDFQNTNAYFIEKMFYKKLLENLKGLNNEKDRVSFWNKIGIIRAQTNIVEKLVKTRWDVTEV